ncbi:MAG TPA: helicase-related protein, partial [Longimicrobiales bacterium]|nr:helicase-related protein [Longimicrobiales bacterium]
MTGPPGRPAFCPAAPRDVARILLDGLLGEGSGRGGVERRRTRTRLTLTAFQRASLEDVRRVIAERRGAVLADSVGMGKTFVALALIAEALGAGRRVAVVVPTALLAQWRRELRRRVAVRELPETRSPGVVWYTHARLSRGAVAPEPAPLLVVVDEAHAFRSPATRRYRALASLCRDAEVLLMTATPVNNTLMDLYHLLRFFSGDGDYRDLGIADLGAEMRALAAGGLEGGGSRRLDALLRAVVVRRTRQQVRGRMGGDGAWKFPERAPPIVVRYELVTPTGASTDALVRKLAGLSLAPLRLREYGVRQLRGLGPGESELLRIGLLKRLASSLSAFRSSIRRQRRFYQEFLAALGRRKLLAPAEFRRLYGGDADVLQLVLEPVALGDLPGGVDVSRLAADTRADLEILDSLERDVAGVTPSNDPKLSRLRELLDGPLVGRRVVIFTEYRDTARVLWNALVAQGHVGLVDGSGALLGRHSSGRRAVVERFAPLSNGARPPPAHEAVHILIATDVLSEGLNLQDASHVVSYDLPWNPVRIAQRIGRLDRLGSPHATVHAWNFAPDAGLDAMLRLMTRLRRKLRAIAGSVGQDGPVLGTELHRDERVVARWAGGDASVLDDIERAETAPFLVVERLRALRRKLAREPRKMPTPERPPRIPYAAIRDPDGPDGALVGVRAGSRFVWIFVRNDGSVDPDAVGA